MLKFTVANLAFISIFAYDKFQEFFQTVFMKLFWSFRVKLTVTESMFHII